MRDVFSILERYAASTVQIRSSRHAAALVYKGRILSIGVSSMKTHPIMLTYGKNENSLFLHAEIDAIVKCINQYGTDILKSCTLYVLRLTKSGNIGLSKPCKGCQRAIDAFSIKDVVWS